MTENDQAKLKSIREKVNDVYLQADEDSDLEGLAKEALDEIDELLKEGVE